MSLERIMQWFDLPCLRDDHYTRVMAFVRDERQRGRSVLPADDRLFFALTVTPFEAVNVVIVGQDPYPTREHAMGLAFSVNPEVSPLPKTLGNIFKELYSDLGLTKSNGDLTGWAQQGVLLLNAVLTVEEGHMNAHRGKGWETVTAGLLSALNTQRDHLIFVLWGKSAQDLGKRVRLDNTKHTILSTPHPSPMSAHMGFWGSKPFSTINADLHQHHHSPINFSI